LKIILSLQTFKFISRVQHNFFPGIMTKDQASKRFYRVDSNYDFTAFMDRGQTAAYENRWVFETAWEVCNKGL